MSERVVLDVEVTSPIDRVWQALTDSATLSMWMLFEANDCKPVVGHTFEFSRAPGWDGAVDCEVLEVDEPRKLTYTWASETGVTQRHATVVTWTLTEGHGGVTRLHLEKSGFRPEAKQEIGGARYGWKMRPEQLAGLLVAA